MIQYLYIFTIIVAYCCLSILSYDILRATLYYANPINNTVKFSIISKQLNLTIGLIFFYSLGFIVAVNAPLHDNRFFIITPFIVISIALVIVSYICFHVKQQCAIKHAPLIPKSFNIKLINPILISLAIVWWGYISNPLFTNLYNSAVTEFLHFNNTGNQQVEKGADNNYTEQSPITSYKYNEANATQSSYYQKEHDFMVAVLNNPQFNLYDFITASDLHESNTQFLTEAQYWNTKYIKNKCAEMGINDFHSIYNKVRTAWGIFKEIQDTDVSYDGMGKYFYNYGDWDITKPSNCPYPELKHKLSIVPLQLK